MLHQRKSLGQAPVLPQAHNRQLWVRFSVLNSKKKLPKTNTPPHPWGRCCCPGLGSPDTDHGAHGRLRSLPPGVLGISAWGVRPAVFGYKTGRINTALPTNTAHT